jgi:hypothetical protein
MLMAQLNFYSVAIEDGYGIKVLHDPKSPIVEYVSIHAFFNDALRSDPYDSIVFVHGLTGGQTTTWTAEGETSSWPEKFLSQDIPTARILAFGYDADVVKLLGQASQNNIDQHARNLLGDLADIRSDSHTVRCLISTLAGNSLTTCEEGIANYICCA